MGDVTLHIVLKKYHVKHEFEWHSALLENTEQLCWIVKLPSNAILWSGVACLGTLTPGSSTLLHCASITVLMLMSYCIKWIVTPGNTNSRQHFVSLW